MQETTELDIRSIIKILLKNLTLIAVVTVLGFLVFFVYSKFIIRPQYTSSISMYVNNTTESAMSSAVNINDINASQKLVNTYIVILKDDEVLGQVAQRLMQEYALEELENYVPLNEIDGIKTLKPDALRQVLTMSAVDNTEVLQIKAQTKNAAFSARICTIISEIAPEVLQRVVKAGSVEVIGQAEAAYQKSYPNTAMNSLIGLMLGLVLSVLFVLVRNMLDNTIKGEEDIKERLDIPVLGEIPDFESQTKGGYSYGK